MEVHISTKYNVGERFFLLIDGEAKLGVIKDIDIIYYASKKEAGIWYCFGFPESPDRIKELPESVVDRVCGRTSAELKEKVLSEVSKCI